MFKILLLNFLMLLAAPAMAITEEEKLNQAKEKIQQTYSHMNVSQFQVGPIPGTYELITGNKVIYYHAEAELLIFGDVYDKAGNSLTENSRKKLQASKLENLDKTAALVIGSGEKTIVEFTDPECGYCRKLNKFLIESEIDVKREIYFSIRSSNDTNSSKKAIQILCSTDPEKEFQRVFRSEISEKDLVSCEQGIEKLTAQKRISDEFGVSGTPTLVLGDSVVTGFRKAQIAQYLE